MQRQDACVPEMALRLSPANGYYRFAVAVYTPKAYERLYHINVAKTISRDFLQPTTVTASR